MQQSKESKRDLWWFGIGIFLLTIAFITAFAFVGFKMNLGFLRAVSDYKWLLLMAVILVLIFNQVDKKLIRGENVTA
jgi:amino acid transporter